MRLTWKFELTLEYYLSIFVVLMLTSGVPEAFTKKNFSFNCSLSQKLHGKYKSHLAVWALTKLLYSNIIWFFMISK